jgi:hypothetical protein
MQANWTYIVVAICLLLAAGFTWQEIRRVNKHRLVWRVLVILITAASLACITLPIGYERELNTSDEHKIILLTKGFDQDSLNRNDKLYTFDKAIQKANPNVKLISPDELKKTDQLHVYGYGLNEDQLKQLNGRLVVLHAPKAPAGISNLSYTGKLNSGEQLRVQGSYNNTSAQKVKLVLKGLHTGLDSVIVPGNAATVFELSSTPKTTGKLLYSIYADNTLQGDLPLQIDPVKPVKVLMLSASPDFETRFLKNWLSENGYAVALRSAISKDKLNTEFINIAQFSLDRITAATLSKFDVVIGDLSVLNGLSIAESSVLKQQVADNGLGIIVKADSSGKSSWLQSSFPLDRPSSGREPAPSALIINGKASNSSKLSSGQTFITYREGTQSLMKSTQGHMLASSTIVGQGKLIFTTLGNTFSWVLAGDKLDYAELWSALINKAAKKNTDVVGDIVLSAIPLVNEPVSLQLLNDKQPTLSVNGETMPLEQNMNLPFEWSVIARPGNAGWQSISVDNHIVNWYVHRKNEWESIQASVKMTVTKKYADKHIIGDNVTKQIQQKVWIAVPKIYFYILLLAACTFLWIENKLS